MGTLIGLLTARGMSERLARMISTAALVLLVLGACTGLMVAYNHHVIAADRAKTVQRAAPATDAAAAERAADTIATAQHEQELHDVIAAAPDQPIAPTSRALGCKRLHDVGRDPPACR
jgi:pyruvoyl-dependent arginine decarboxylase (PvlArgDC)